MLCVRAVLIRTTLLLTLAGVLSACAPARPVPLSNPQPRGVVQPAELPGILAAAALAEPELARSVAAFPWARTSEAGQEAFASLAYTARTAPAVTAALLPLAWLQDDVSPRELTVLRSFEYLALYDARLATQLAALPWLDAEMTVEKSVVLAQLFAIAQLDRPMMLLLLRSPFLQTFEGDEGGTLEAVLYLEHADPRLRDTLTELAWFDDGLTNGEAQLVASYGSHNANCGTVNRS